MTINVMIHCRDGIVLGCDSLGSMINQMLIPNSGTPIEDKQTGQPLLHPDTKEPIIDVKTMKRRNVVVNTLGNENKLIQIKDYPVGILASGIGIIGQRSIESLLNEFSFKLPEYTEVKSDFKMEKFTVELQNYIADLYSKDFKSLPNIPKGPTLEFLIGGYSSNEYFGEIYRLKFPINKLERLNSKKNPYAMSIGGERNTVERFMNGMEKNTLNIVIGSILSKVNSMLKKMDLHTRNHIFKELNINKIKFEEKNIPPTPKLEIEEQFSFKLATYNIQFGFFSVQNAVDFVVFLIYITYGAQRFVSGIPTVGGDVKIAYITKHEGFKNLTPKEIDVTIFKI